MIMSEKIAIDGIFLCEGKYDKVKLESLFACTVIPTHGFAIYKDKEKRDLLKELAKKKPIYIITDSDTAGFQIRAYLKNTLKNAQIHHIYIPDIYGKEKRKDSFSKEGKLGVEGIDSEIIKKAVLQVVKPNKDSKAKERITKQDFYFWKLSGHEESKKRRSKLLTQLNLPSHLSSNALLDVINILFDKNEVEEIINTIFQETRRN